MIEVLSITVLLLYVKTKSDYLESLPVVPLYG